MAAMDPKKMICTEPFLYQYMKAFDELLLFNELFNRKESQSNEISHRKRFLRITSTTSAQDVMQDMSTLELQKFLADKSCIINAFRKAFDVIPCPEEKYMLIRVMGLGLYLIGVAIKITEKDRLTMYDRAKDAVANGQVPDTNQYKNERVLTTFHKGGLNLILIKCKDFSWDDAEDKYRNKKEKMNISETASIYGEYVCSSMGKIITILRTRTESKRNRVRLNNPQMIRQGGETESWNWN
ncbi:MAG: hypothetical protein EZS28_030032 [Streblomastix strix]|uniref:Uncharacterized protein n=1 Tax=Streblomastix strix TaxID=222440 RepID=A0A5J4UX03_9EUKA|nr:MAG: hypothetical protein EZS28_030032 [Streblomastix strix]